MKKEKRFIIGIDEVGRGALAGPVVVGAVMMPCGKRIGFPRRLGKLKDSKKLSARQRERWLGYFNSSPDIFSATARVYPRGIEKMNVSGAANRAASKAFGKVSAAAPGAWSVLRIYLDGGLSLGNGKGGTNRKNLKKETKIARTVIKGDEKITAIKIASIIAKVSRDRFMVRLAKKYPAYGFDIHKGYGTKAHFRAIRKHGASIVHRKTFL